METESNALIEQLRLKHENQTNQTSNRETPQGVRVRLRALLVALLGVSMSACAFASQPVELELDDEDVAQRLNNVSFARRITKPTIRLLMGYGKLSAVVTAFTSLLLLVAVMSKQSWHRRGTRWLAAPALLVTALEIASDAGDAILAALLRGSTEPIRVAAQTVAAAILITIEILVWYETIWAIVRACPEPDAMYWLQVLRQRAYEFARIRPFWTRFFIAKFFEYNPPMSLEETKKDIVIEPYLQ